MLMRSCCTTVLVYCVLILTTMKIYNQSMLTKSCAKTNVSRDEANDLATCKSD